MTYSTVGVVGGTETSDGSSVSPSSVPSPVSHSDNFHSRSQRSRSFASGQEGIQGRAGGQHSQDRTEGRNDLTRKSVFLFLFFPYLISHLPPFLRSTGQQGFAKVSDRTDRNRKGLNIPSQHEQSCNFTWEATTSITKAWRADS